MSVPLHPEGPATAFAETSFTPEQLRAERQRCYELGVMAERERTLRICRAKVIGLHDDEAPAKCEDCPSMGSYGHGEPPPCTHPLKVEPGPYSFANPRGAPPDWCPLRSKTSTGAPTK